MTHSHEYDFKHWQDYYEDKIGEKTRLEMIGHLSKCSECLNTYTKCVENNISLAPLKIKKEIMKALNKPINTKQIMLSYVVSACIAIGFYSLGLVDKTLDYAPKSVEKSFHAITTVSDHIGKITNDFIWRDFNEKEK